MRVAVVGAGYAGLALCWHLLQKGHEVTVFDAGGGATLASTGLLHPFPGKKAELSWRAREGMQESKALLEVAGKDTFSDVGILRMAVNEEQKKLFQADSFLMKEGIVVFSKPYLKGLKKACAKALFIQAKIEDLKELQGFDQVILATGAKTQFFKDIPLKKTIGQCLVCSSDEPLGVSLLAHGHISLTEEKGIYLVGSTYEHTKRPDPQKARDLLLQLAAFYPPAKEFKILDILAGTRATVKHGYKPVIQKLGERLWLFTALGSRGLLYHSLLAKELVDGL